MNTLENTKKTVSPVHISQSNVSTQEVPVTMKKTVSPVHISQSNVFTQEVPMTMKKTVAPVHISQSHESNVSAQEVPMTTNKTVSNAHVVQPTSEAQALASAISTPAEGAPQMVTPATLAAAPRTRMAPILAALAAPPDNASIPAVPSDYVPRSGASYRSVAPKKAELLVLAQAVKNLAQLTNYTQVMGPYAPPYEETLALFTAVYQWSALRTATLAWDAYSIDQEGIGWATLRPVMERLRSVFDMAVTADPTLLVRVPSLAALLGARTAIAQKGAATRQRNRAAKAKGEPQTHGEVGKTRKRAAEKAALATLRQQQPSTGQSGQRSDVTASAPVKVASTPTAAPATPAPTSTPIP